MSHDHAPTPVERHCDVAVVGGSTAGLAAALQLGRQRRSVIVLAAAEARRRPLAGPDGHRLGAEGSAPSPPTAAGRDEVRRHGGEILAGGVTAVTRTDADHLRVELVGGHAVVARRVLLAPDGMDELADIDGLRPVVGPGGPGAGVAVDATGQTVIAGLYAAGPETDPGRPARQAAARGGRVGAVISRSLADEDLRGTARPSGHEADWDHRYGGEQIWSGNPNGALVHEVSGMTPGRALDVGAGEGGDALWLARQGWEVTASDISARALDRVGAEATRRGLHVERRHIDANAPDAFEPAAFDLVSAQYASIPRTPDDRGVHNLLEAVAPGGTLLVVQHDLDAMRAPVDTPAHYPPFDPDAYLRTDDFETALLHAPTWDVEVHEKRPRPAGASTSHHVEDVVLRARRLAGP